MGKSFVEAAVRGYVASLHQLDSSTMQAWLVPLLQHRGIGLRELNSPAIRTPSPRKRERSGASKASSDKSLQRSEVAHLEECIRTCEDAFQLHIHALVRPVPPGGRCCSTLAVLALPSPMRSNAHHSM